MYVIINHINTQLKIIQNSDDFCKSVWNTSVEHCLNIISIKIMVQIVESTLCAWDETSSLLLAIFWAMYEHKYEKDHAIIIKQP